VFGFESQAIVNSVASSTTFALFCSSTNSHSSS
jgi:hypothetical protein